MTEENGSLDISRYWAIIYEKRHIALAVGLAVLSLVVWGSFFWPKTYEADSTIFIRRDVLMQPFMKESGISSSIEDELKILKNSLTSRNIVDRVLRKLNMDISANSPASYETLVNNVRAKLDVTIKEGKHEDVNLFVVSYESGQPKEAQDIVNTLVNEYMEQSIASLSANTANTYSFINSQLQIYKDKLDESDRQIMEFKEKHPDMALQTGGSPSVDAYALQSTAALQSAAMDAQIKLKDLLRRKNDLEMELAGRRKLTSDLSNPGSPQATLNDLESQLITLRTKYTDNYPEVVKVKSEIALLKKEMESNPGSPASPFYQQLKGELDQTNSQIGDLSARLAEMSKQQRSMTESIGGLPPEQAEWSKLDRDRSSLQKIYDDMQQKLEGARASKDLQAGGYSAVLKVVDPAELPVMPVKPNRIKMIMMGLLLGAVSGVGAAIGLEHLNNSYFSEESLEAGLKVPVLISIPRMTTAEDTISMRRKDRRIFMASGAYVLVICVLLVREVLLRYMGIRFF